MLHPLQQKINILMAKKGFKNKSELAKHLGISKGNFSNIYNAEEKLKEIIGRLERIL